MSLAKIIKSHHQRKQIIFVLILVSVAISILILAGKYLDNDLSIGILLINFLLAVLVAVFSSITSVLLLNYYFVDPLELDEARILLPNDIAKALSDNAKICQDYKIYVRTGRHFRAEILPLLVRQATQNRQFITLEIILLDFRDESICKKYAEYRKQTSFDKKNWNTEYAQIEILATIIKLLSFLKDSYSIIDIKLYLSTKLSTFRIEGSLDKIIVTREDPKDIAYQYKKGDSNHAAFLNEFRWIKDSAEHIVFPENTDLPILNILQIMFAQHKDLISHLFYQAEMASNNGSPYSR